MKEFRLIQHNLIPLALIAGNIAIAHLIYLLAIGLYGYNLVMVSMGVTALTLGIVRPNKYLLLAGIIFYTVVLFFGILL